MLRFAAVTGLVLIAILGLPVGQGVVVAGSGPTHYVSGQNSDRPQPGMSMTGEVYISPWRDIFGIGVLTVGVVLVGMLVFLLHHDRLSINVFYRLFGLSIVLTAGLSLYAVGYDHQQIAPMFGLLGTIAGYILGKADSVSDDTGRVAGGKTKWESNGHEVTASVKSGA